MLGVIHSPVYFLHFGPASITHFIPGRPRNTLAISLALRPEPVLADEEYDFILTVIERVVHVMERSPRAFAGMDEPSLRDHILVQLNGHYEGRATGETFNAAGKTDILIRIEDKNVFIAECKFWHGPKELMEAADQVLGYTSWRDTKTALVIFNRGQDHKAVLEKIRTTLPTHPCFKHDLGNLISFGVCRSCDSLVVAREDVTPGCSVAASCMKTVGNGPCLLPFKIHHRLRARRPANAAPPGAAGEASVRGG